MTVSRECLRGGRDGRRDVSRETSTGKWACGSRQARPPRTARPDRSPVEPVETHTTRPIAGRTCRDPEHPRTAPPAARRSSPSRPRSTRTAPSRPPAGRACRDPHHQDRRWSSLSGPRSTPNCTTSRPPVKPVETPQHQDCPVAASRWSSLSRPPPPNPSRVETLNLHEPHHQPLARRAHRDAHDTRRPAHSETGCFT